MKLNLTRHSTNWKLVIFDLLVFIICCVFCNLFPSAYVGINVSEAITQSAILCLIIFIVRFCFKIYHKIWRFEGVSGYLSMTVSDIVALIVFLLIQAILPYSHSFRLIYVVISLTFLLMCLISRFLYRYIYKYGNKSRFFNFYYHLMKFMTNGNITLTKDTRTNKINIAVIGAGTTGQSLTEDLHDNPSSHYKTVMYIDTDKNKVNKTIDNVPVFCEDESIYEMLNNYNVKEIVVAIPEISNDGRQKIFDFYKKTGCKLKMYDGPTAFNLTKKPRIREIDIEDLMPRKQISLKKEKVFDFYKDKKVLITGGGGSIGSEIARQIALMKPKSLILLDIYENGAYDVKQEINIENKELGSCIDIEICSITNKPALDKVFSYYKPEIVIHAAAHKHVPLMEHNCIEAIYNNIVGTANLIEMSEKYQVQKFMLVSSDKAVNPTNVMGATKRFCEMLIFSANNHSTVSYAATRFGNVLGSAGSVIPLFKKQIANGGPVTITDKRITRYFMTIPEASSLVLEASVISKDGELFVLDMGKPVKIIDLINNMIDISGAKGIEIEETGLRPGEKLFEELLIENSSHKKIENDLIFIEKENFEDISTDIEKKYKLLLDAIKTGSDKQAKQTLKEVVDNYKDSNEVNNKFNNKNSCT